MFILHYLIGVILLKSLVNASNSTIDVIPESYVKLSENIGNSLWTSLMKNCQNPTLSCVKDSVYSYLEDTLGRQNDLEISSFLKFSKNNVSYEDVSEKSEEEEIERQKGDVSDDENELDSGDVSPFEEISRSLREKSVKFLMTHDVELQLPDAFFDGAVMKVSPRTFEGGGTVVKMDLLPKQVKDLAEARIFKKIKKFITDRLIWALLAILLVIKLLSVKFLFFMPMVMGMAAAKKLLIKVLLFIFPFLQHLFKLCPYVPHGTKHHYHKHQIAHVHHLKPHHHGHGPPVIYESHGPHGYSDGIEVIRPHADGPPIEYGGGHVEHAVHIEHGGHHGGHIIHGGGASLHHYTDVEPPHRPSYNPHEQELDYMTGGPALTHHFLTHREDDVNEVSGWGQGHQTKRKKPSHGRVTTAEIENMVLRAEKEALIKARLQQEKLRIGEENKRLQEQLKQALRLQEKLKHKQTLLHSRISTGMIPTGSPPLPPGVPEPSPFLQSPKSDKVTANQQPTPQAPVTKPDQSVKAAAQKVVSVIQQQHQVQGTQNKISSQVKQPVQPVKQNSAQPNPQEEFEQALYQASIVTYDKFYSPILDRIDKILDNLGFTDEPCKERLICSMYKSPVKFSPHSNLLSAELSRDSKELAKPTSTNAAVIRFYRYVQAARDGQDKRDCLRLYATCSINTEK